MATLNTLVDLLKSKAKKTTEDDDLLEFEKGKYFFGIVKNKNKYYEGIIISRKFEARYSKRIGFKIIDTIDEYSEKNQARIMRYLED